MKDGTIIYTNPLSKFLWESGIAYVFYGAVAVIIIACLVQVWRTTKK